MSFSLFYLPTLSKETDALKAYQLIFDEVIQADKEGWDTVWLAEHHFDRYGGIIPSIPVLGAALAMKTNRIRIGSAISVLTLNSAIKTAEDFAMLDVLSNGRLEFGVGRGFMPHEFNSLNIDLFSRRSLFDEGLEVLLQAWNAEKINFSGQHYQIKDLSVLPKPLQQPPPIWIAASTSKESFELAGQYGFNLMINPYTRTNDEIQNGIEWYKSSLSKAGYDPVTRRILSNQILYVAESEVDARVTPREAFMFYLDEAERAFTRVKGQFNKPVTNLTPRNYDEIYPDKVMFGTPEFIATKLDKWLKFGVTDFCFMTQFGNLSFELANASRSLFVEKVMPLF